MLICTLWFIRESLFECVEEAKAKQQQCKDVIKTDHKTSSHDGSFMEIGLLTCKHGACVFV